MAAVEHGQPIYVEGGRRGEVFAHFKSGLIVRAGRGRARSYPGLRGTAPPTLPFYSVLCRVREARHVLDLGCGAGEGTRRLASHFEHVTGVDNAGESLAFARAFAPLARFVLADAAEELPVEPADLAVVVDVLGHLKSPERVLSTLRENLAPAASVLFAEPESSTLQRLIAPARRGYTRRSLEAVLTRAGFSVSGWVSSQGSFVACLAERSEPNRAETPLQAREAALSRARACIERSEGDAAAEQFMLAASLDPSDPRPIAGLAELALASGDAGSALRLGLEAARLDACEPSAARVVAFAADELEHPDALGAWRIAVHLAPDRADVVFGLARAASLRGDHALGITALERLAAYGDRVPRTHVALGWLLKAEGRSADAELAARQARAEDPDDPEVEALLRELRESGRARA